MADGGPVGAGAEDGEAGGACGISIGRDLAMAELAVVIQNPVEVVANSCASMR
jgi:hypothetical protein